MNRRPVVIFSVLCVAAAGVLGSYLHYASSRRPPAPVRSEPSPAPVAVETPPLETTAAQEASPPAAADARPADDQKPATRQSPGHPPRQIFFRYNGVDSHYGAVAHVLPDRRDDIRFVDSLQCEVVHVSGGHGICLSAKRGVFTSYAGSLFDARTFAVSSQFPLKGIPSRSRVSADGSLAALTVFVTGHGYTTLDFSTQTLLVDVASGNVLADLETFAVTRDGQPIRSEDFNFWGVTFTPDAKNFYATLSTAGKHYLIRGDVAGRSAEVIHENVECPSLSPDARHVAYKKRFLIDNRIVWQLHVIDVGTRKETPLAEKRSIDDQLEWLDDEHVLYSVPSADDGSSPSTDVWVTKIDGATPPTLFLKTAYSPAVVH